VLSPQEFALDHRRSPDARAERDHDEVVATARGTDVSLSQQRHACVILDGKRQSKLFCAPGSKIDFRRVVIFLVGGGDSSDPGVRKPAKPQGYAEELLSGDSHFFGQITNGFRKPCQLRTQWLSRVHGQVAAGED